MQTRHAIELVIFIFVLAFLFSCRVQGNRDRLNKLKLYLSKTKLKSLGMSGII